MDSRYYDWRDNEVEVTAHRVMPKSRHGWTEYAVKRTANMPDWLYDKFQAVMFADGWQQRPAYDRNLWIHLYDCVLCETVSIGEADEYVSAGFVPQYITARASNYMHTVAMPFR